MAKKLKHFFLSYQNRMFLGEYGSFPHYLLERGDFQFFFKIFVAFGPNSPMTIRFIQVCLKMFVSVWKTLHPNPILREQPNLACIQII